MTIRKLSFLFAALLVYVSAQSQDWCGTDGLHSRLMNADLEYRNNYYNFQRQVDEILENNYGNRDDEDYVIPVVVHVFHLGEPVGTGSNISDEQILGAINGLNEKWANQNGIGVDLHISFAMAKRDPYGCPTNGILRIDASGIENYAEYGVTRGGDVGCYNAVSDEDIKDLSLWPVSKYYNIWVVNTICGGWAGYAYYPWGGAYDGAIMHKSYMTYSSMTLAHELGHAFNLPHTFEGDNNGTQCPLNTNCATQGDKVCDTPPHKVGDCGPNNPCTDEGIWYNSRYNYMSYCGGTNRFTEGQKSRIRASVLVYPRVNLLSSDAFNEESTFNTQSVKANVTCIGQCNGSISVTPTCEGDYTYTWENGESGPSIENLCPGDYSVLIHDAISGWEHTMSFTIAEGVNVEAEEMFVVEDDLSLCEGESVILTAIADGSYLWSNGSEDTSITVTESGEYFLTLTNDVGCSFNSDTVQVSVHEIPEVSFTIQESIEYMDSPFVLNTGFPAGGEYWGPGVSDGMFYPALAGAGTHVVHYTFTSEFGCSADAEATITVNSGVAVENLEDSENLVVYPNPNEGNFTVVLPEREEALISCYDASGRLIYFSLVKSDEEQIAVQLGSSPSGVYFLRIKYAEKEYRQAILIQKK